ncbi:FYVE and coiled-coil domain-containing protein 1-like [Thalassophryne amazonica]|uniref:FYVE and coiled-coil domain-containing protein 1-like n=1 Tax=Thalassophryne amazonica TaxID=390379 RepID=UPI001470CB49|nr:FYVE and coiled-coil domain-containing protein 1-like [Thalassophryne amazonica]
MPGPDLVHNFPSELGDLAELSPCGIAENLRIELDQSELRRQELMVQVQELSTENVELKSVVQKLQGQLLVTQTIPKTSSETDNQVRENVLQTCGEAVNGSAELQNRLSTAENRNTELCLKLDEVLKEKGQQASSLLDTKSKIQDLMDKLMMADKEKMETKKEAEDWAKKCEHLVQELKLREEDLKNSEEKLAEAKAGAHDEQEETLQRLEELQSAVDQIQGALTLKEKETGNLRAQLQDLQASLDSRERQAEELKKRLQQERDEVEHRCSLSASENEELESQLSDLRRSLKDKDKELAISSERVKCLEKQLEKIIAKEESIVELDKNKAALLEELASLRVSEKQLKDRVEAAEMTLEDQEKTLLDENLHLEEIVQESLLQKEASDAQLKILEHDKRELVEIQALLKKQLATTQEELNSLKAKASEVDKNLMVSQRREADLLEKLQETGFLQGRAEEMESRCEEDINDEKGVAENKEKMQKLPVTQTSTLESKEDPITLVIAEAQLELNKKEVQRLQEEVVALRAQLMAGTEERMRIQALQEVTEASREDLCVLAEQLKAQVEELNHRHVADILQAKEREETLIQERDSEAQARAGLAAEMAAYREKLHNLKLHYDAMCLENSESQKTSHRANTETAELGVHVCMLSAVNEEARLQWEDLSSSLQELKADASQEVKRLNTCMEQLQEENQQLRDKLHEKEHLLASKEALQEELVKAQQEVEALRERSQEETQALQLQLGSQSKNNGSQLQTANQELQEVRTHLTTEQEKVLVENRLKQLEAENQKYCQQIEEKNNQMAQTENLIQQKEDKIIRLKGNLSRSEEHLAAAERTCRELGEKLQNVIQDKQKSELKTAAELDDLYRTKSNLEERLIELIREKDALWQKSDALEFEQKLRDEETGKDVNYCLSCHNQFSWFLRKYNCRLCGRPFCYNCCNNTVHTQQGGIRECCCRDCYNQHSTVVERHPQEGTTHSTPDTAISHSAKPGKAQMSDSDDGDQLSEAVYDIITEDEVRRVCDTNSVSSAAASSPHHGHQGAAQLGASADDALSEDAEELGASVQDAEISLLKAGELTLSVHYTVDEISSFGDSSRELFIRSSCYSTIPIIMSSAGPTVSWTFTSEPKSIFFSVVYRENAESPLEQAKVLIPLTRCNSHKETIQGELKVRNPGEYTLIFDNSFSRFISKNVLYHLSANKPVVKDGDDHEKERKKM